MGYKKRIKLLPDDLSARPILGKGKFGTVYVLDDLTCVKINKHPENNRKEIELYKKYSKCPLFPRIYDSGRNYIIMEYIKGSSLRDFLDQEQTLDNSRMEGLLKMFAEAEKVELSLNPNARHIIFDSECTVRLVDLEDIEKFASPKPFMLFHRLKHSGQKDLFLDFVKQKNTALYKRWTKPLKAKPDKGKPAP